MIPRGAGLFCGLALWLAKWNKRGFKGGILNFGAAFWI